MQIESARLAPCGDIVHITWRSSSAFPGTYGTPDWKNGHRNGKWFDVAGRSVVNHVYTAAFVAANGTVEWQTYLHIGNPIVYGTASGKLSIDAGLLTDKYGNTNAGVTNFDIDVSATLVDATGFLDLSITPGAGGFKVYVDPETGTNSPTIAGIKTTAGAAKSFNALTTLLIANNLQDKGCHILYLQGKQDVRTHTDPYPQIKTWGPSPNKPCIIGVADGSGNLAGSGARVNIRLSNNGVNDGLLYGIRRDTGGVSDCPNVCINGFDIKNIDQSGTSQGAGIDVSNGATNFTVMDCRIERMLSGLVLQSKKPNICVANNQIYDSMGLKNIGSNRRPFGMYLDYCVKGAVINGNVFDRNGKTTTDLTAGENEFRDIYISKEGDTATGGLPTGPVCLVDSWHLRGSDTAVQLRTGGGAGVVWHECAGAGFSSGQGGGGWNTTACLETGDLKTTDGTLVSCGQGPYINNSIKDHLDLPSNAECSRGGILEANVMYPPATGAITANFRGISVLGSNLSEKHDYINRNNVNKGVPIWINSVIGSFFGGLVNENNIHDTRGAAQNYVIYMDADYTGQMSWYSATGNAFFSDSANPVLLVATPKSLAQYRTLSGTDGSSVSTPPTFADATRGLGKWAQANGLVGTKAAFYAALRTIGMRSRPSYIDAWAAARYFIAGLKATNYTAFGTGWLDITGAPDGLPVSRASGTIVTSGVGTQEEVVNVLSGSINAAGTTLTLTFSDLVSLGALSGTINLPGPAAAINLSGLTPSISTNTATINFSSRGKILSTDSPTISLGAGSFKSLNGTVSVPAFSGSLTNGSTQGAITHPTVSSVSNTATTIAFVFGENIATAPALTGAITVGTRTISLDGLSRSIASATLTLDFTANGIIYKGETVTVRLDAEAVSSSANGGYSNAFNGSSTNGSGVTLAETITSFQIYDFFDPLYNPFENKCLQIFGDSIMNPGVGGANTNITTQWNLICGWFTAMRFPWNGYTCPPLSSSAYCGGYTNLGTVTTSAERFPGDTPTEGGGAMLNIPVPFRDVQLAAGLTNQAAVIFNLNKDVLPSNRSTPINLSIQGCTQQALIYQTARTHQSINGLAGKNSAAVQTIFTNSGQTNGKIRKLNITGGTPVASANDENPKASIGYYSPSTGAELVVPGTSNDMYVALGCEFKWPGLGVGVHMNVPVCKGGVTVTDHASESVLYTTTALGDLFQKATTPDRIVIQLGQNLSVTQSSQLNAGDPTDYQNQMTTLITKIKNAVAAANTANSVPATTPRFLLVVPYRTGYNAVVYKTIATACHNIALADPTVGWVNLYLLSPLNTNDTLWTGYVSGNTTYTCDGVHPNNAGMLYFMDCIQKEALSVIRQNITTPTNGFVWTDPILFAQSAGAITKDYTLNGGLIAMVSNKIEFQGPGGLVKSRCGADWVGRDGFVEVIYDSVSGTLPSSPSNFQSIYLIARKNGGEGYYAKIDVTTNAPARLGRLTPTTTAVETVLSGPTNIGTLAQGDVLRLEVSGSGPTFTLKKNGSTVMSLTASDAAPIVNGAWEVRSYAATSTLKLSKYSCGALTPYAAPASVASTKPWFSKLVLNLNAGNGDAQAQSSTDIWTNGWEDRFSKKVDRFINNGGEGIWIRGEGGNNSQGINSGRTWSSTSPSNTAVPLIANMMNLHGAGYLRTGSNFTTPPADGRLLNDFQTVVAKRRGYLKRVHSYISAPPNGRTWADSAASGLVWPNSNSAHDFYHLYVSNLGMTPVYDTWGSADPLHAESVTAKASIDRAKTYDANRRPIVEPHTATFTGYSGGTFANNLALTADAAIDWASIEGRYDAVNASGGTWYGAALLGTGRSIVIFDTNAGTPAQVIAKCLLARDRGWHVVADTDPWTTDQEKYMIDTFKQDGFTAGSGNQNNGRFLSVLI